MRGPLTIAGLGPGSRSLRTLAAQRALDEAARIILRTAVHPGLADLRHDPRVITCDDLYERGHSFEMVYHAIVNRVIEALQEGPVVYAVPGHPRVGEATVGAILEHPTVSEIQVDVLDGVSAIDSMLTVLGQDIVSSEVQIRDALELAAASEAEPFSGGRIDVSPTRGVLVMQLYSSAIASSVKLSLIRHFPDEHQVAIVSGAGSQQASDLRWCPLHEIDHHPVDHLSTLWVPPLSELDAFRSVATLQRIVARLRAPDGCPWDREQSHQSLRAAMVEEAYEVVDAIDAGDPEALAEELGDVLFQPLMHAQIAEEAGDFSFEDIVEHATRKLIRRHPHVFGEVQVASSADVIETWEAIKRQERQLKGHVDDDRSHYPFDRLPRSMPVTRRISLALADKRRQAETVDRREIDRLSTELYEAVAAAARAGLDPETELERIARLRLGERKPTAAEMQTAPPSERS